MRLLLTAVKAFRSQLSALNVSKGANPHILLRCKSEETKSSFSNETALFQSLIRCGQCDILGPSDADPSGCIKNHVSDEISTYIKVAGLVDIKLEIERVKKRNAELNKYIEGMNKKISIPNYETKVPANVR
jgi:valyl-tRNA synthetase